MTKERRIKEQAGGGSFADWSEYEWRRGAVVCRCFGARYRVTSPLVGTYPSRDQFFRDAFCIVRSLTHVLIPAVR